MAVRMVRMSRASTGARPILLPSAACDGVYNFNNLILQRLGKLRDALRRHTSRRRMNRRSRLGTPASDRAAPELVYSKDVSAGRGGPARPRRGRARRLAAVRLQRLEP